MNTEFNIPKTWKVVTFEDVSEGKNAIVDGPFGSNLKTSDYIEDKVNGLLVKSGDSEELARKICLLLKDEKLAKMLVINAQKTLAKKFNLLKIVRKLEETWSS